MVVRGAPGQGFDALELLRPVADVITDCP